jgi:hypothetical protein
MARGLKALRPRRRLAAAALVLMVIALHLWVTTYVTQTMADWATAPPMPPRIAVTYVRELELAPPPVAAPVVVATAPRRPRPSAAAAPAAARAASAPAVAEAEAEAEAKAEAKAEAVAEAVAEAKAEAVATDVAVAVAAAEPPPAAEPVAEPAPKAEPASADPAASATEAQAFDWPASTRITYELSGNYRGAISGDAQVEWVRVGSHYQVNIDLGVGPLIARRMTSEGELVGDRLLPSRYDEVTRVVFRERRVTILLGPDEIVLDTGERRERKAGVQDSASQFIQLAAYFTTRPELLRAGNTVEVLLALRNRIGAWVYDVLGQEDIATPIGPLAAYHLRPRSVVNGGNELTVEVWFAPQLRYLPVRMLIRQDADTFVDLVLSRRPDIAAQ